MSDGHREAFSGDSWCSQHQYSSVVLFNTCACLCACAHAYTQVRSIRDASEQGGQHAHIMIGVTVDDDFKGHASKSHFTIDCPPGIAKCKIIQYMEREVNK